jgi:hypothetical protein
MKLLCITVLFNGNFCLLLLGEFFKESELQTLFFLILDVYQDPKNHTSFHVEYDLPTCYLPYYILLSSYKQKISTMTFKQLIDEDAGDTPCSSVSSVENSAEGENLNEVLSAALQGKAELAKFPRVHLAHLPTPLEYCPRLSEALGGVEIYVKRDDCTGLATGGNKARKLGEENSHSCSCISNAD